MFRHGQTEAVVIFHAALADDAVILAAGLDRIAAHHQARLGGVFFPRAMRVRNAHHQNASIAVDIFGL